MAELNLGLEHAGAGTDGPGDNGLGNDALLDGINHLVLLDTTDLTKQDQDLAVWVGLVSQQVVDESGARISVTTNGDTLVDAVGVLGDDVVELVGHTTRLGDVANGTLAVQLGGNNVVHHTTSVTNLEAAGLDATDSGRANDGDALLLGDVSNLTSSLNDRWSANWAPSNWGYFRCSRKKGLKIREEQKKPENGEAKQNLLARGHPLR